MLKLKKALRFSLATLSIAALSISTLSTSITAQADEKPIEQFYDQGPSVKNVGGYSGVLVDDTELITNQLSNLVGVNFEEKDGAFVQKEAFVCRSFADPNCSGATNVWYNAILDFCKSASDTNCIAGVSAIVGGKEIVGKFQGNYPTASEYTFKGDATKNIPDGNLPTIFTFDGLKHDGGDQFMIFSRYFHSWSFKGLAPEEFTTQILAVSIKKDPSIANFFVKAQKADALGKAAWWNGPNFGCASLGTIGECAIAWPLPKDVRFKLDVRTSIPLNSFMHGRLMDPVIKITNEDSARQLFSIEAGAVTVPILYTWVKNTDMPKALYDYLYAMKNWGGSYMYIDGKGDTRDNVQLRIPFDAFDSRRFQEYLWWLEVAKDKSIGNKTMWVARTLSESEIESSGTKRCLGDKKNLTGIVSTNANMYISAPPTFNEITKTLDYKVASPHVDDKGKENVGSYNLVLSSEAARCLYNFTKAPVSATVSIVSADGSSQVATTAVTERNGWLYLSANGFTYSSPLVRVKLTQETETNAVTPTPSPSPSETPSASPSTNLPVTPSESPSPVATATPKSTVIAAPVKKITITCVKGKVTKKITAIKPSCPIGYKKK
ncbi:MAG: hypothetical protein ACKOFJ_00210 [Actinomycetota bacterium]